METKQGPPCFPRLRPSGKRRILCSLFFIFSFAGIIYILSGWQDWSGQVSDPFSAKSINPADGKYVHFEDLHGRTRAEELVINQYDDTRHLSHQAKDGLKANLDDTHDRPGQSEEPDKEGWSGNDNMEDIHERSNPDEVPKDNLEEAYDEHSKPEQVPKDNLVEIHERSKLEGVPKDNLEEAYDERSKPDEVPTDKLKAAHERSKREEDSGRSKPQEVEEEMREHPQELKLGKDSGETVNHPKSASSGVIKVLLVTYMRGGSSVLGELFNQNNQAMYWFEPFAGLHSHLYGVGKGWAPLQSTMMANGTVRPTPEYEKAAMVQTLKDIYDCNIDHLPLDVLTNYNFLTLVQRKVMTFTECMRYDSTNGTLLRKMTQPGKLDMTRQPFTRKPAFQCKDMLERQCSIFLAADSVDAEHCHGRLHTTVDTAQSKAHIPDGLLGMYRSCMAQSKNSSTPCFPSLQSECNPTTVRAAKVIRINLDLLPDIIKVIPDIKIIVYHRDPRAIVASRYQVKLLAPMSKGDMGKEAKLVCEKMLRNSEYLDSIKPKYVQNIMELRYEDLATDPMATARVMYDFIGTPLPPEVESWVQLSFHAPRDAGQFGTSRRNATHTANKWRHLAPEVLVRKMSFFCLDALGKLNYTL